MTNWEVAEYLDKKLTTISQAIAFLEGDCGISGVTKQMVKVPFDGRPRIPSYLYFFRGQQIWESALHEVYAITFIQNLMPLLTSEEKNKVIEKVQGMVGREPAKASGGKAPAVVNNVTNNNSAHASAQNTIDIKNLSELSAYVSNSSTITNKAEIQNTLSALEDAKDGDSAESYIGLLIKLIGLLCKDGILPPFVGKLVDGLGKRFK